MVIDSHALYWWLEARELLSTKAAQLFNKAVASQSTVYVCGVSFWELHRKELMGSLTPKSPVDQWPRILACFPWLLILPTTPAHWIETASLDWSHRDPADRMIAATARSLNIPVLTKDRIFHSAGSPVDAVW